MRKDPDRDISLFYYNTSSIDYSTKQYSPYGYGSIFIYIVPHLVYNLNELNFTVHDFKTGNNLKNITANIAVVNSPDPTFKFDNITAPDGVFSIKCPFLNEGTHQVIVNIRSSNNYAAALASFNLTVPLTSNSS